jgi:hypothetical protein
VRSGSRLLAGLAALAFASAALACGRPSEPAAVASPEDPAPEVRLERLTATDVWVARVAWKLARANAELCPLTRPRAGWRLQAASQYGSELRPLAEARYGLDGDLPGVLAAPEASPAATAGLAAGDLILALDGAPLERGRGSGRESYDGLALNTETLDNAVARAAVDLKVRRGGAERNVRLSPVAACAYDTEVTLEGGNARVTRDGLILIPVQQTLLARSDDELAFPLAHELAHLVLEHDRAPPVSGRRGEANGQITLRRGRSASAEADADRLGLYLLANAGYDPAAAVEFLTRYGQSGALNSSPQVSLASGAVYRSPEGRRRALEPVIADIAARRAAGRPLIP